MLRVPGTLATLLWKELRRRRHPYGVEVGADPYEVFAPGANRSVARPLFRRWFTRMLRKQCRDAAVAAYVTRDALQRRYPTRGWSSSYSDVELRESDYAHQDQVQERLRRYRSKSSKDDWLCVHIGTMAQAYKRQDALIRAVAECRHRGVALRLKLVGSGRLEPELRALARAEGVGPHVDFVGQLPAGDAIRAVLDQADILVLPSQTEGLPRVILEAMARGVPCLATDVGGLRELLDAPELFHVRDIPRVASKIEALVTDISRLSRLVHLNIERARAYGTEILRQRRRECYSRLAIASRTSTAGNQVVEQRR
jgi:glycosyltransferase involved in cell wall biosynthesis